jgi:hypothetical protein
MSDSLLAALVDEAVKDESLRDGLGRSLQFQALAESDAWGIMRDKLGDATRRMTRQMANSLMAGGIADQRRIDYLRGYIEGVDDTLALPGRVVSDFEKALERAYLRAQAAAVAASEEEVT